MNNPTAVGEAFQENGVWYQDYNIQESNGATVVKRFMHNGTDWVEAPQPTSTKIDFTKKIQNTEAGLNLKKSVVNLDKCLVNLSKSTGINLGEHKARVAAVVDFSGSMRTLYNNGSVQRALNRLVPLALRFDDNGELDVWLFHSGHKRLEGMDVSNFENYTKETILGSGERFGTTKYAPVLEDVYSKYIREEPSKYPAFVIFITDGANDDKRQTDSIIRELSKFPIFVQFVGLGQDDEFVYLKKLDDLTGRAVDNTGFIEVASFDRMSDDQLYKELLEQYVDWLKALGLK